MRKGIFLLALIISIVFSGCSKSIQTVIFSGNIEGDNTNISAQSTGIITGVEKAEGDAIKAGDEVYIIDDTMLNLQRSQIENQIGALEVQLKIAKDKGNEDAIKIAQYNLNAAQNSLDMVNENINRCTVKSPVDGVIGTMNFKKGEMVQAGTQLFTVTNPNKLYLTIFVPEKYLSRFSTGQNIDVITPDAGKNVIVGKIVKVDTQGQFTPENTETVQDKSNIVYGIKIDISSGKNIKPGMIAEVKINE